MRNALGTFFYLIISNNNDIGGKEHTQGLYMSSRIRFGTDGWRSRVDTDFSADNVRRVAKAITEYLISSKSPGKGVFIGYDGRSGSRSFAEACAEVLAINGIAPLIPLAQYPRQ